MHIAFAINPYQQFSGVGTYYRNLYMQLRKIEPDIRITVFLPKDAPIEAIDFFRKENTYRMPIPNAPSWKRALYTYWYRNINSWWKGEAIDLLHSFSFPGLFCSGKNIMTIYDMRAEDFPSINSPMRNIYAKLMKKSALQRMDGLITISEFTRERLVHHYPEVKNRSTAIHLGGGDRFINSKKVVSPLPHPYILAVSHIMPRKNLALLVNGFNLLLQKNSTLHHHLLIVGKKYEQDLLFEKALADAQCKDRIHLSATLSENELAAAYRDASLFVFPSLYEGFGIPLLEAGSFGVPCLAANTSVFREMMVDSSDLLFESSNPQDLCNKMEKIIVSPEAANATSNLMKSISNRFTWKATASKTANYYKLLIGKN